MEAEPARRLTSPDSGESDSSIPSAAKPPNRRVLVVDDEENICNYLSELFRLEGWHTDVAFDGYQGVRMVSDNDYDVIVMDILMPRMTGIEATREIMKRKPESHIIVITGAPYRHQAQEALDGGAKIFIKKPFSSSVIIDAVKKAFQE